MSVVDYVANLERPLCSMSFNGIIFEDAVPGYRTVRVEGRDAFSNTIDNYSTKLIPGSRFRGSHEESKDITVTFALVSETVQEHRKALDKLRSFLIDPENREARIIFNDEPDVFYIGSVSSFSEEKFATIEHSAGQMVFRCSDIRKFSVQEYESLPDVDNRFIADYNGSRNSKPDFYVTFDYSEPDPGESIVKANGVAFMDEEGNVLQFGSFDVPTSNADVSQLSGIAEIVNQKFTRDQDAAGLPDATWTKNTAVYDIDGAIVENSNASAFHRDPRGLYPYNYGTYTSGNWNGLSASKSVVNVTGAKNWECEFQGVTQWQNTPVVSGVHVIFLDNHFVLPVDSNGKLIENKVFNINFVCFEGTKQIECQWDGGLSGNTLFASSDFTDSTKSTNKSNGRIQAKLAKGISIPNPPNPNNGITFSFVAKASTGNVTVEAKFYWYKESLTSGRTVIFSRSKLDIQALGSKHESMLKITAKFSFNAYEQAKRVPGTVTSVANFIGTTGETPGIVATKKNSTDKDSGYVQWVIPNQKAIGNSSGSLQVKIAVKGASTTETITKTIAWNRVDLAATRKDYSQRGIMQLIVAGERSGQPQSIAEIRFVKANNKVSDARCYINLDQNKVKDFKYTCEKTNPVTGTNNGKSTSGQTIRIKKIGNKYTFEIGGNKYSFTNENALVATSVAVSFARYREDNTLERQAVKGIFFGRYDDDIVSEEQAITEFKNGDVLYVSTETGEVYVNDVPAYGLGALGNDWESFALRPGLNGINLEISPSNVSLNPNSVSMRYREVF